MPAHSHSLGLSMSTTTLCWPSRVLNSNVAFMFVHFEFELKAGWLCIYSSVVPVKLLLVGGCMGVGRQEEKRQAEDREREKEG